MHNDIRFFFFSFSFLLSLKLIIFAPGRHEEL